MTQIIECIPNFSEGRDKTIIDGLAEVITSTPGVTLLDHSADSSHNRSVYTFIGSGTGVTQAAISLAKYAARYIDLTRHTGEHPRMGAVDVIPFVPLKNATMDDCIAISKEVGAAIAREAGIPVFLYENSAPCEARRNLADIRRGGFKGMAKKIRLPEWKPDYGETLHPTAGAVAVGARMPLIAFNVNLSTSDISIANKIAKTVRGSSGGLKYCKAIGIMLHDPGIAQVSMNMVNYESTPLYRALELIRAEAHRHGVGITGTELIGLAPAKALIDCAEYYLQIENFDYARHVLENHF